MKRAPAAALAWLLLSMLLAAVTLLLLAGDYGDDDSGGGLDPLPPDDGEAAGPLHEPEVTARLRAAQDV